MIELTYIGDAQTVNANAAVEFNRIVAKTNCSEYWDGANTIELPAPGTYLITASANIAIPTDGTPEEISLGIAIDGTVYPATIMRVTPAAAVEYFNVSVQTYVHVRRCFSRVSLVNASTIDILVDNPIITKGGRIE